MDPIQSVKGTRDFYPELMAFRSWLYSQIRSVSEEFGYQEFEGPYLEPLELYAAKSGEELVSEQAFIFPDRSGDMITLRPELTPTLARMVAAKSKSLTRPIRWWSFGPFWRYERPQRGRTREFFQWNIDVLGLRSPQLDAEIATVAASFFKRLGLTADNVNIRVNHRQLAETQLQEAGFDLGKKSKLFHLIDRKDRLDNPAWREYAADAGLSEDQIHSIEEILSDEDAWQKSEELVAFFDSLDLLGSREYFHFDPTIIRGLDYYTGTVFEARDKAGKFRAILGGGRYDGLVEDVGGDPMPAMGFALGDVVLSLVLQANEKMPSLPPNPSQLLVANFGDEPSLNGLKLAADLRELGIKVEWFPEAAKMSKQLRYADRQQIPIVAIVGPDEVSENQISLKVMASGDQTSVPVEKVASEIEKILGRGSLTSAS